MSLPIVTLPEEENWDCHQCGICCRGSLVPLSVDDLKRLQTQNWEQHPDYQGVSVVQRTSWLSSRYRLAQRDDGSCVFLNEQGLCRIHAELGFEAKPTICRVFPLQIVPHHRRAVLTIRRACPSSAVDRGQTVDGHLPFVRQLVADGRLQAEPIDPPPLKRGEWRDWATMEKVLTTIARLLGDQRFPPVRRMTHGLTFVNALDKARTKRMDDSQLLEFVDQCEQSAPEQAGKFFQQRTPPGRSAGTLFRLIALEHVRLLASYRPHNSWRERIRLALHAVKMVRGRGALPQLRCDLPETTFAQLEQPLGTLTPEVLAPLSRLLETSADSFLYAIANRQGWSLIESFRGLAIRYPVGMWLLRWCAVGRVPTQEDMIDLVVALDRGQGHDSLSGSQHRWRLQMLASLDALEPLTSWYAQ